MFDHTCSGLKKSKFLWVLHVVYCTYSGWKKSNFVYFWHVWPYLQWSEKVKILMVFCIWLTVLTVVKTGLNFYGFLHVIYCTFWHVHKNLFITIVVGKSLNLCIFDMFDNTCSGLKKSKFYVWVFCSYLLCSFSTCGLPYLQWLEKV